MLMTDLRSDYTRTSITLVAPEQIPVFSSTFEALSAQAAEWFDAEGLGVGDRSLRWVLDVRYVGQNYEIGIDVPVGEITEEWIALVTARFHDAHEKRYGYSTAAERVEAATFRVEAIGDAPQAAFPREPIVGEDASAAVIGTRDVYLPEVGERVSVPLYARDELRAGNIVAGPAVIEQYDTTALVLPGEEAVVDEYLMIVTRPARGSDDSVVAASDERILSMKGQSA
jgi:N-methylhydantoinase A